MRIYVHLYAYIQENHSSLYLPSWKEIIFKPTFLFGFDIVFAKIHLLSLHIHFLSSITDNLFQCKPVLVYLQYFSCHKNHYMSFLTICILMSTLHFVHIPSALHFKVYFKMFSVNA